jgi:hypothetical protein
MLQFIAYLTIVNYDPRIVFMILANSKLVKIVV